MSSESSQLFNLRINSLVALRDLDGLPGASNFPYFFFEDDVDRSVLVLLFIEDEMFDDEKELVLLLTFCGRHSRMIGFEIVLGQPIRRTTLTLLEELYDDDED